MDNKQQASSVYHCKYCIRIVWLLQLCCYTRFVRKQVQKHKYMCYPVTFTTDQKLRSCTFKKIYAVICSVLSSCWNLIIFAGYCSAISAGIRGGFFKVSMARLSIRVRNYLFASLARQEIGFFDVTKTGNYSSKHWIVFITGSAVSCEHFCFVGGHSPVIFASYLSRPVRAHLLHTSFFEVNLCYYQRECSDGLQMWKQNNGSIFGPHCNSSINSRAEHAVFSCMVQWSLWPEFLTKQTVFNANTLFYFKCIYICVYIVVYSTGDITSRLTSDTTTMSNALSLNFNIFIRSFIKAGWWKSVLLILNGFQNVTYFVTHLFHFSPTT